jgi:hypothetical protein
MNKVLWARPWLLATVLAVLGLFAGVVLANAFSGGDERFTAQATLAMLPDRDIPPDRVSSFWEILNRGQATGSAAIVLKDNSWLPPAAAAAGVAKSDLELSAGAIPDTTLITLRMTASSAEAAEAALSSVLNDAVGPAAAVSGPFRLVVVSSPNGSARSMSPTPIQLLGAFGIAGMLTGAGAGLLISRSVRERSAGRATPRLQPAGNEFSAIGGNPPTHNNGKVTADTDPLPTQMPLQ